VSAVQLHARSGETWMMLIVVYGIEITEVRKGEFEGSEGTLKVWNPWRIDLGFTRPSQYDHWPAEVRVPPNL
jgi:hypothetical protein